MTRCGLYALVNGLRLAAILAGFMVLKNQVQLLWPGQTTPRKAAIILITAKLYINMQGDKNE